MILNVLAVLAAVVFLVLGLLYLFILRTNGKQRKKPHIDTDFEPQRALNYPPPFPNGWFSLCSASAVQKGQVIEVTAFGKKLAVFRGHDGKVGVMDVYCPHLGANLADGKVVGNRLVCPFHAWEFNTQGNCEKIPYCDKENYNERTRAKAWTVNENWGLILVWHHANNEPPTWHTQGYLEELKVYKHHGSSSELLHMHLQDFSENGADYAHFGVVHNLLTIPLLNKFFHVEHTTNIEFGEGNEKHMAWFTDIADIARTKDKSIIKDAGGKALVTYYGPGFLVFSFKTKFGNPIIVKTFTPIGKLKLRMEDHVYAPKGSFGPAIKYIVGEATAQFHDDINIWERKTFNTNPVLVKGDGPIMNMRKWYSQFYGHNKQDSQNENTPHGSHLNQSNETPNEKNLSETTNRGDAHS